MSYLAIRAPLPALCNAFANRAAELISRFPTRFSSTASLKEKCFGAERFKIGRIFVFCCTAIRGFTRKCLRGVHQKDPLPFCFLPIGQWCQSEAPHERKRILHFLPRFPEGLFSTRSQPPLLRFSKRVWLFSSDGSSN